MRRGFLGTAAAITLALAAPTPALATTRTVDPVNGDAGCTGNVCKTIPDAAKASGDGDTIRIKPGTYAQSALFTKAVTVTRMNAGEVRVVGDGTAAPPMAFNASGTSQLQGITVLSGTSGVAAVAVTSDATGSPRNIVIDSSILSGAGTKAGLTVSTGAADKDVTVTARHVTIADAASAPATSISDGGGVATIKLAIDQSIVQGSTAPGTTLTNTDSSGSDVFVNRGAENFHLSASAPDIDAGGGLAPQEFPSDVDGDGRPQAAAVDKGADEFVDTPPNAPAVSGTQFAYVGDPVALSAGASDPDPGGSVTGYTWDWGDGSASEPASGSPSSNQHVYSQPGTYFVTVSATDNNGRTGGAGQLGVVVFERPVATSQPLPRLGGGAAGADAAPPAVSITTPRPGQRLRLRVGRAVPSLRGRVSDDTGVRSVELALSRKRGSGCQWFDGRRLFRAGSCARPRWFRARVEDFAWRYSFPRGVRPSLGTYRLAARATDILGNRSAAASVAARTAATFRFVR